jgi:hypothetical protein
VTTLKISREQLLAFAESKPAATSYDFFDPNSCFLAQYGREVLGWDDALGGVNDILRRDHRDCASIPVPKEAMANVLNPVWGSNPTFGQVAQRLKTLSL